VGSRGPQPNPNAIRRNKREVTGVATVGKPTMPAHLSAEAKAEWRRVVPALERMGTITKLDRGNLVRSPLWLLRRDAEATATELGRQLGLTPDARVRAGVKHEQPAPAVEPPLSPLMSCGRGTPAGAPSDDRRRGADAK